MAELQSHIPQQAQGSKPGAGQLFLLLVARLMPARLDAWFIERFLSVKKSVSLAAHLPPRKASAIIDCLSTAYLVEATEYLDPKAAPELLKAVSPETTARIAKSMSDERAFDDISVLVGYLSPAAITEVVRTLHSGDDMLKIAIQVQDRQLLSPAMSSLPTKRLPGLFTAAERGGHWQVVFEIVEAMDSGIQRQLGERLADLKSADMTAFLHASLRHDAWSRLLHIFFSLSEHARHRLAANIAEQSDSLHLKFMIAARDKGRMQPLLKLVSYMPMDDQRRLVRMAGRHGIRITSVL